MESRIPSAEDFEIRVIAQQPSAMPAELKPDTSRTSGLNTVLVGFPFFSAMPDVPEEDPDRLIVEPQGNRTSTEI
jgi:hypothetical protein